MTKKKKPNPWAICTKSVGRDNKAKYERCVLKVKKKLNLDESVDENMFNQLYESDDDIINFISDSLDDTVRGSDEII